jgi:hypothetical protein
MDMESKQEDHRLCRAAVRRALVISNKIIGFAAHQCGAACLKLIPNLFFTALPRSSAVRLASPIHNY